MKIVSSFCMDLNHLLMMYFIGNGWMFCIVRGMMWLWGFTTGGVTKMLVSGIFGSDYSRIIFLLNIHCGSISITTSTTLSNRHRMRRRMWVNDGLSYSFSNLL